jgi:hypothetical protein
VIDTPPDSRNENVWLGRVRRLSESKFFDRSLWAQGAWQTIAWWEMRRIPYNLLVGAVGLVSGALCLTTGMLCEHFLGDPFGIPDPPFFALLGVVAYGLMANLCYTGGWVVELLVRKIWPERGNAFGQISFSFGLVFSILLTLTPGILISTIGAIRLLEHSMGK